MGKMTKVLNASEAGSRITSSILVSLILVLISSLAAPSIVSATPEVSAKSFVSYHSGTSPIQNAYVITKRSESVVLPSITEELFGFNDVAGIHVSFLYQIQNSVANELLYACGSSLNYKLPLETELITSLKQYYCRKLSLNSSTLASGYIRISSIPNTTFKSGGSYWLTLAIGVPGKASHFRIAGARLVQVPSTSDRSAEIAHGSFSNAQFDKMSSGVAAILNSVSWPIDSRTSIQETFLAQYLMSRKTPRFECLGNLVLQSQSHAPDVAILANAGRTFYSNAHNLSDYLSKSTTTSVVNTIEYAISVATGDYWPTGIDEMVKLMSVTSARDWIIYEGNLYFSEVEDRILNSTFDYLFGKQLRQYITGNIDAYGLDLGAYPDLITADIITASTQSGALPASAASCPS